MSQKKPFKRCCNFLTVKGVIEPVMIFESPFSDINTSGIMGVFGDTTSRKIISLITSINDNAQENND